jgi:hypothetical protein
LKLQLYPPPINQGTAEVITVDSLQIDITNPNVTFNVPDEWVHAIKYAALTDLFSAESQLHDPLRYQYVALRYQQAVDAVKSAKSVLRLLLNGVPLPIDTLAALDAASPYWRNQTGPPQMGGVLYDFVAVSPGLPDQAYGIAADVAQSAPLPAAGAAGYIQMGYEDIPHLIEYAMPYLTFKCGGKEFQDTFSQYDAYMSAVARRGQINKAKIRYLKPLFDQPQKEQGARPDVAPKEQVNA